jgi:hypothetical protein
MLLLLLLLLPFLGALSCDPPVPLEAGKVFSVASLAKNSTVLFRTDFTPYFENCVDVSVAAAAPAASSVTACVVALGCGCPAGTPATPVPSQVIALPGFVAGREADEAIVPVTADADLTGLDIILWEVRDCKTPAPQVPQQCPGAVDVKPGAAIPLSPKDGGASNATFSLAVATPRLGRCMAFAVTAAPGVTKGGPWRVDLCARWRGCPGAPTASGHSCAERPDQSIVIDVGDVGVPTAVAAMPMGRGYVEVVVNSMHGDALAGLSAVMTVVDCAAEPAVSPSPTPLVSAVPSFAPTGASSLSLVRVPASADSAHPVRTKVVPKNSWWETAEVEVGSDKSISMGNNFTLYINLAPRDMGDKGPGAKQAAYMRVCVSSKGPPKGGVCLGTQTFLTGNLDNVFDPDASGYSVAVDKFQMSLPARRVWVSFGLQAGSSFVPGYLLVDYSLAHTIVVVQQGLNTRRALLVAVPIVILILGAAAVLSYFKRRDLLRDKVFKRQMLDGEDIAMRDLETSSGGGSRGRL